MKKKKYLWAVVLVVLIITIAGSRAGWFGDESAIEVTAEKVQTRNITETITANGRIRPQTEVKISPDVPGEIVELNVKEGDEVEAGKLLAKIKPDTYMSIRDRAEASLQSSRAELARTKSRLLQLEAQYEQEKLNYNRKKKLWESETISRSEYEAALSSYKIASAELDAAEQNVKSARFSVKSAKASLREAEEDLRKTNIHAPASGTISRLSVEEGERVVGTDQQPGTEMMRIADLSRMEANVEVNENDIVRVDYNDTAYIDIDAYPYDRFRGVVSEIAKSARDAQAEDQITNFEVKIIILPESYGHLTEENPDRKYPFMPGMSATVDIETESREQVPSVPIQAVTTKEHAERETAGEGDASQEIVFKAEDSKAKTQNVETGIQDNFHIEIISGLLTGDKVITAPYDAISRLLTDGSPISVVSEEVLYN